MGMAFFFPPAKHRPLTLFSPLPTPSIVLTKSRSMKEICRRRKQLENLVLFFITFLMNQPGLKKKKKGTAFVERAYFKGEHRVVWPLLAVWLVWILGLWPAMAVTRRSIMIPPEELKGNQGCLKSEKRACLRSQE